MNINGAKISGGELVLPQFDICSYVCPQLPANKDLMYKLASTVQ